MEERIYMNKPLELSRLLAERRNAILERWTTRIRSEHADDRRPAELRDHLPRFFEKLLIALGDPGTDLEQEAAGVSAAHGTQRLRVGFDLAEVLREYEVLIECILEELETVGRTLSHAQLRRVLRLLDVGRVAAVAAYIARRDRELARAHSQHVAFIAHEQRTPLMSAFNAVSVLRKNGREDEQWALALLHRSLSALRGLIDQALIADRLLGQPPIHRESLDLRAVVQEVVIDLVTTAAQRRVQIHIEAPDTLPISGDPRLLRSAIGNLVGNAIKFTHEGSTVAVRASLRSGWVAVEVEDHCGGLPQGRTTELFEPLMQRGADRTGFGLGLAIVKQAIEGHGGRVHVQNVPGKGCIFSLQIPTGAPVATLQRGVEGAAVQPRLCPLAVQRARTGACRVRRQAGRGTPKNCRYP
jgi:hypothetical protein